MAVVKANYVKRGEGDRARAKASIRYITHRRDREGNKITRELFGFEGTLSKQQAYRMIDAAARRGRYYYRVVLSPDPKREDRYKDLYLRDLTTSTMLRLEERLGQPIQFVAAIHDDHAPHRHVHIMVIHNGRRLTRGDFAALRQEATERARTQRRVLERLHNIRLRKSLARSPLLRRDTSHGTVYASPQLISYICPACGRHEALPAGKQANRCLADGVYLQRMRPYARSQTQSRGYGLELNLSP